MTTNRFSEFVTCVGLIAIASVAVWGSGCSTSRGDAAKDWSHMLREMQIVPTFPPREDFQVGDVYSDPYDTLEKEEKAMKSGGYLKIPDHLLSLDIYSELTSHYAGRFEFPKTPVISVGVSANTGGNETNKSKSAASGPRANATNQTKSTSSPDNGNKKNKKTPKAKVASGPGSTPTAAEVKGSSKGSVPGAPVKDSVTNKVDGDASAGQPPKTTSAGGGSSGKASTTNAMAADGKKQDGNPNGASFNTSDIERDEAVFTNGDWVFHKGIKSRLSAVGFPEYSYTDLNEGSLSALIPIQSVSAALGVSWGSFASASLKLRASESYGLPAYTLYTVFKKYMNEQFGAIVTAGAPLGGSGDQSAAAGAQVVEIRGQGIPGAGEGTPPNAKKVTKKNNSPPAVARHQEVVAQPGKDAKETFPTDLWRIKSNARLVMEVYLSREIEVTINFKKSGSFAGGVKPGATLDNGWALKPIEDRLKVINDFNKAVLTQKEPGGYVQLTGMSDRSVTMKRVFYHPVVVGFRYLSVLRVEGNLFRVSPSVTLGQTPSHAIEPAQ